MVSRSKKLGVDLFLGKVHNASVIFPVFIVRFARILKARTQ
uniref:Uncharacterized protein n=1 Tax=Candidatus Kentrum sp. LFY TaxID=2126342 RepID=A0A450V3I4_9GAMM|nr:MAG: hypothetical protein BECKLFY1418A_GA0070994_10965 [Candidatus Kentron sp. LFY]